MKKILSILGEISLVGISTTSLVACNKPIIYTPEQSKELKEKNNITTKDGILEWIAPQEKPFNKIGNKWYYVVWHGDKNNSWKISKFQNNKEIKRFNPLTIDNQNENTLDINKFSEIPIENDLTINASTIIRRKNDNGSYFKSVYCWNDEEQKLPNLDIDKDGNVIVKN